MEFTKEKTENYEELREEIKKELRKEIEAELKKEVNAEIKLKRLKRNLVFAAMIAVAAIVAISIIWFQGKKLDDAQEKYDALVAQSNQPSIANPVSPEISLDVLNTEIKEIGELATTEYLYTNAAKFTDSKQIKNWNIPFTEKSFVIKWDGVIKAGIDVEQITTKLDETNNVLTVVLPTTKILSHDTKEDSVEILVESSGLFNSISLEDKIQFDAETVKEMEERAIQNGLLEKAQKNAEAVIFNLLCTNPDIVGHYSIEFESIQE